MAQHPVDVHVGRRLRSRRIALGLSQESLGRTVGITFQQVQKYERGSNRIASSRLYEFSRILGISVSYLFEEYETVDSQIEVDATYDAKQLRDKELSTLVKAYSTIENDVVRKRMQALISVLGE